MKNSSPDYALILMALGGLESIADIEPFLRRIMKKRPPTEAQISEIKERYQLIGGKSPLNEITKAQAEMLQARFDKEDIRVKVFTAFRFSPPYIADTLSAISALGIENVLAFNIAPQRSEMMICQYREEIDIALADMVYPPRFSFINGYYSNENFLKGMAENVKKAMANIDGGKTTIIFTAHSVPVRQEDKTDEYEKQLRETVEGILKYTEEINHLFGYQSKGFSQGDWLEPSVETVIETLADKDIKNVLFVSVGFVSDNLEILYDIDICYRKLVEDMGLKFYRSESLNKNSKLIEAIYETSRERFKI